MTSSIMFLQMNVISQIWIYLPLPLMIDPSRIKEHDIPQIWSQLPSLLPLKTILVLWPPLLIRHISFLLIILILSMLWRNMWIYLVRWREDTDVVNMIKNNATKRQGSITPHALLRTIKYIIFMGFPWLIQRQGLDSWNINIICHNFSVDCCVCLPYIIYFTCCHHFVIFFFLFHWSLPVIYYMSALIKFFILYYFCWLFECVWWQTVHTDKIYWPYSCLEQAIKDGNDLMQKKLLIAYWINWFL